LKWGGSKELPVLEVALRRAQTLLKVEIHDGGGWPGLELILPLYLHQNYESQVQKTLNILYTVFSTSLSIHGSCPDALERRYLE